ncbi:4'-phosphopantetheinyl transferase family protein [Marilutibacter spongiae]|uniref:4'-phosphopantetheinyl transferase family protein n=1 Tax=Marilutibacter spongiae TaxID=2025720 RepID=UPI0031B5A868
MTEHPTESTPAAAPPVRWHWLPRRGEVAAEAQARDWLAGQLQVPAEQLQLRRDTWRRPRIEAPFERHDVNWSHSGQGLLVALAEGGGRVGVDLEWERPRPRALELAKRYFTALEHAWLAAMADPLAREQAFLRLWCAKEAVLKAHGRGLAFGLDRLAFVDGPAGLRLVECDPALGHPDAWTLQALQPAPGYLGALAWRPDGP